MKTDKRPFIEFKVAQYYKPTKSGVECIFIMKRVYL